MERDANITGYQFVQNDLVCEDWRSRDRSWDYGRIALGFFEKQEIPFPEMREYDALIGNLNTETTVIVLPSPVRSISLSSAGRA